MEEEIKLQAIKEALKKLKESSELGEREQRQNDIIVLQAKKLQIEIDGRETYFKLRREWSFFLMCLLGICVIFQFGVTIFVGLGILNYMQYQWFINLVMGENFLQIIGLCYIVVKFLFPQHPEN